MGSDVTPVASKPRGITAEPCLDLFPRLRLERRGFRADTEHVVRLQHTDNSNAARRERFIWMGTLLGAVCTSALAVVGVLAMQRLSELADPRLWLLIAAGTSILPGAIAGAAGSFFLLRRAPHASSFSRMLLEAALAGVGFGAAYLVLGAVSGDGSAPNATVIAVAAGGGLLSGCAMCILLRPLYWHRPGA
jgi:hypothetical protein